MAPEDIDVLQHRLLLGVSRTFALTIPRLPRGLCRVVSNGYLLCRLVDTIEDDPALSTAQKRHYAGRFPAVLAGEEEPEAYAAGLAALLSAATIPAEHELVRQIPAVVAITRGFEPEQREALLTCVRVMAEGMIRYQEMDTRAGLADLEEMERYCYYVAGVVGEMLTRLFCARVPAMAARQEMLEDLAIAFGQGLQMTNILKDIWDDHARGACWLPRDVFAAHGFDLADMRPGQGAPGFEQGVLDLVAIAQKRLRQALDYTLAIPAGEAGLRSFCFLAIGMAEQTLRRIQARPGFSQASQVKISRRTVKGVIAASQLAVRSDTLLRLLFRYCGRGLP